jgi:hypothetical protein
MLWQEFTMAYKILIKIDAGIFWREAKTVFELSKVTSDGETIQVQCGGHDFRVTAVMCNEARENSAKWHEIFAAAERSTQLLRKI